MKEVNSICKILVLLVSLVVVISDTAQAQDISWCNPTNEAWAGTGSYGPGNYTAFSCSNQSVAIGSTNYFYWASTVGETYTISVASGGGWTTPAILYYYYNGSAWVYWGETASGGPINLTAPAGSADILVVPLNGTGCTNEGGPAWTGTSAVLNYLTTSPTASGSGSATVCATTLSYTIPAGFTSSAPGLGTISWSSSGDGTFTNGTTLSPTYNFGANDKAAGGTKTLTMTVNNGGCTATATFSLTIDAVPIATPGTASATVCASTNSYTITGYSSAHGTAILWSTNGDGTFTNGNTANPVYNFGPTDKTCGCTRTLTMTVSDGGVCTAATTTFALTIDPTPTATQGGTTTATICGTAGQYTIPGGYTSTNGAISWTSSGDGAFTSGSTSLTPTYSFGSNDINNGGIITLTMHVTGDVACTPATTTFILIIDPLPTASLGGTSSATVCSSSNAYNIPPGYTATNGTILWTTSGDGTFTNITSTTPTYTYGANDMSAGGTITLTMTVSNAACASASATFALTIDPAPEATPGATTSAHACVTDGQFTVPAGYTSDNGTISWTSSGDGAFISGGNTPTPTYFFGSNDQNNGGLVILTMTVTGAAACAPATTTFALIIDQLPIANPGAITTANACGFNNSYTVPAGYTAQYGTISWSTDGDGTFTNGSTLTPTYHFGPNDEATGGVITLTMSVTNAGCGTSITTFTLTINPATATAGATTSATICAAANSYTISGYTAANGTISWSTTGDGTFTGGTTASPTYNLGPIDKTCGCTRTLTMSVTNGPCVPTASFDLTISPTPTATAGGATTARVCASVNSYTIPAGYASTNGTISWSTSGDGTFTNGTTTTPIYTFGTNDIATGGVITLTMSVNDAPCTPATATFALTIDPIPAATAGATSAATVCGNTNTYTIPAGYTSANGAISWSSTGDGTFTSGATTLTPTYTFGMNDTSVGGVITLTMTVTGAGVCPPATAIFTLTIVPAPIATAGSTSSAEVCASVSSYTIPAGYTAANGTISWSTSGDGTFTSGGTTTAPTYTFGTNDIANGGAITLTMSVSNATCVATTATFILTIDQVPTTATVGALQDICGLGSNPLGGNTPTIGTGLWTQASGPGTTTFSNTSDPLSTDTASVYGTYIYTWMISNGVCTASTANVTVNFWADPTPATVGPDQSVCGLTSDSLGGNNPAIGIGTWSQVSGPGTTTFSNAGYDSSTATASAYGTYVYTWTISNGNCTPTTANITVTYYTPPTPATTGPVQGICGLTSNTLGGNTPVVGTGAWSQTSGPGTSTFSNNLDPASTATATAFGSYIYAWTITSSIYCPPSVAYDTVTYFDNPTPATVGANQSLCGLTSNSMGGNAPSIGIGTWSQASGPGTSTFSNSNDPAATATVSVPGTYAFTWTTSNGPCLQSSANDTVTFFGFATPATVGANQSICGLLSNTLGGNTPTTGAGLWTQASGPGTTTFSNDTTGSSTATATAFGTYIYTWTVSDTFCPNNSANDTVTYYDNPTPASVGAEQIVCGLTSLSLGGNTPTVGTGAWTQVAGPGLTIFSNPTSGSSTATAAVEGNYSYTWTISNGACIPSSANVGVSYSDTPTVATVGANQNICGSLISGSLGANTPTAGTGIWTQASGTGTTTFSSTSDPLATATVSAYGTYIYTWTISNGPCVSSTANDTVNYYDIPTTATAGAAQNICASLISTSLGGNTPVIGTGLWTQTSGPGTTTFSNNTNPASTATASVYGTYIYTWTISNGSCPPSTANITVNFYDIPTTATTGPADNVCTMTSDPLTGNTPIVGIGTWTQVSGPGTTTFSNINSGSSTATATVVGSYVYAWTISNGNCTPSTANATVNYFTPPTAATVGPNQNICASLISASLGANEPTVGTGAWTQASGPGTTTFSNASDPLATATASVYGTYIYTWTISSGSCPPSTANDTIYYYATPTTATAGANQNICASLISASLGGNIPAIGTGLWTQASGPGTTTFSNANSGPSTATVSIPGTYVYTWTISNGNCPTTSANVTVNFYATPTTATVGGTQNICGALISASLGGNTPTVGTGLWTQTSGPGTTTFSNTTDPLSTATASVYGTYVYTWTISNGSCPPSLATDTVNYYDIPTTATAGAMQNICASLISGSLGGNTPIVGTGSWTQTSGPGTTIFSNASDPLATATASVYGTYVYTWTISNGTCPPSTATTTINFYNTPTTATVGAMQSVCSLTSTSLGGNTPTIGTGAWTQTSGPGTSTFSNSSDPLATATASAYGTYIYTWTISNGTCPPSTANITVNYYATPTTATVGATQNHCASLTSAPLGGNTPVIGTGVWTQTSGPGTTTFSNSADPAATATAPVYGTYIYTWTITNGVCPPSTANDTVNYYDTPTPASVGAAQIVCGLTSNALSGNTPVVGTGLWTQTSGPGTSTFSSATSGLSTATVSVEGTYTYTWTISNGTCPPSSASVNVTYFAVPTIATVAGTQDICGSLISNSLNSNAPTMGTGVWTQTSGPGIATFSNTSDPFATATAPVNGTYVYTWTISNGVCPPTSASVTVNYILSPSGGGISHISYCASQGSAIMSVTGVINFNQYQWSVPAGLSGSSVTSSITLSGTTAGIYTVTVTPENIAFGTTCTGPPVTGTLTIFAMPVIASVNPGTLPCFGINNDTIQVHATTANGSLSYSIDNGATYTNTTGIFPNLGPGTYNIQVMDDSSCTATYTGNPVTMSFPPQLLIDSTSTTNVLCYDSATGVISINTVGGSPGYNYNWSNGSGTEDLSGLRAGPYTVTVTDTHGCTVTEAFNISQNSPLLLNAEAANVLCPPLHNGRIYLPVSGGLPPYVFNWSTGQATSGIYGLTIGTYSATVTDSVGCTIDTSFVLINDSAMSIKVEPDTATINEGDVVNLGIAVYGNGVGDIHYTWTPVAGLTCTDCAGPGAGPTQTTVYTVQATSDSGCVSTSSTTITVTPMHDLYVPNAFSPNADGINDYWEIYGYKKAWVYVKIEIFDRWGEKIFESHDIDFKWDGTYRGTPVVIGVYPYQLTVVYVDGYSSYNKGAITIIK